MAKSEEELRDMESPHPKTYEELDSFIRDLVGQDHDYGTCVYAMSLSAVAAFNFAAHTLGVTGFQASCADLDFLKRIRRLKSFIVIDGEDLLYPQYNVFEKLVEYVESIKPWLREEAAERLAHDTSSVHPDVKAHWETLANG